MTMEQESFISDCLQTELMYLFSYDEFLEFDDVKLNCDMRLSCHNCKLADATTCISVRRAYFEKHYPELTL